MAGAEEDIRIVNDTVQDMNQELRELVSEEMLKAEANAQK